MESVAPGVWKITLGEPERVTPVTIRWKEIDVAGFGSLPESGQPVFEETDIRFRTTARGCLVHIPLKAEEKIYGFGLQLKSHLQNGKKKVLRTNSDPVSDTGDSHAPVPLYLSTAGYGVLVDTARYVSFYCGSHAEADGTAARKTPQTVMSADRTEELYEMRAVAGRRDMVIDIPVEKGVDLYLFAGPGMKDAVMRYNLFSGGGCLPPYWGLGVWYRTYIYTRMEDVLRQADELRALDMPCDVYGIEPGWQSHFYSCSFAWDREKYPDPDGMLRRMTEMGFKVNLWEHVYTHPTSPIHEALKEHAGDVEVWDGLVPDLTVPEARRIFGGYHKETFIDKGISGFKIDECDNSDFIYTPWSFPEYSEYPSGLDGEQMHSLLGLLYQQTMLEGFVQSNRRTYCQVRSSNALAAPLPFVLYSDLYAHGDFIRGLVNSGFCGLLWSPEVRQCESVEDLVRRIQVVVFSPQALINAWMIKNPPWFQYNDEKNNRNEQMENHKEVEDLCRKFLKLRMSLIPYLYAAFARYRFEGLPPIRALVLEHPDDADTHTVDNEYYFGDSILVAPVVAGEKSRSIYLPEGDWYCFWTHRKYEGKRFYDMEVDLSILPVFVKADTLLPIARPMNAVAADCCFDLTVYVFGRPDKAFVLYEDDGVTYDVESGAYNRVELAWTGGDSGTVRRTGCYDGCRYRVVEWKPVGELQDADRYPAMIPRVVPEKLT